MGVDSQPISLRQIAGQHAALMPRHPQGTVYSTSDRQVPVSSFSRYTRSGVAGPERSITTPPHWYATKKTLLENFYVDNNPSSFVSPRLGHHHPHLTNDRW
jgi:hypothetical protein